MSPRCGWKDRLQFTAKIFGLIRNKGDIGANLLRANCDCTRAGEMRQLRPRELRIIISKNHPGIHPNAVNRRLRQLPSAKFFRRGGNCILWPDLVRAEPNRAESDREQSGPSQSGFSVRMGESYGFSIKIIVFEESIC